MAYREFQNEATYAPTGAMDLTPLLHARAQEGVRQRTQIAAKQAAKVKPVYPESLADVADVDKPYVAELRNKIEGNILKKKNLGIAIDNADYADIAQWNQIQAQSVRDKALHEQAIREFSKDPLLKSTVVPDLNNKFAKGYANRNTQTDIQDIVDNRYKHIEPNNVYQYYGKLIESGGASVEVPYGNGGSRKMAVEGKFINPITNEFGVTDNQYQGFLQHDNGNAGKMVTFQAANQLLGNKGEYTLPNGVKTKSAEDIVKYGEAFPNAIPELDATRRKIVTDKFKDFYPAKTTRATDTNKISDAAEKADAAKVSIGTSVSPVTRTETVETTKGDKTTSSTVEYTSHHVGVDISKDGKPIHITTTMVGARPLNNSQVSSEQLKKLKQNTVGFDVNRVISMPTLDGKPVVLNGLNPSKMDLSTPEGFKDTAKQIADALEYQITHGNGKERTEATALTVDNLRKLKVGQFAVGQTNTHDTNTDKSDEENIKRENIEAVVPLADNPSLLNINTGSKRQNKAFEAQRLLTEKVMQEGINLAIENRRRKALGKLTEQAPTTKKSTARFTWQSK